MNLNKKSISAIVVIGCIGIGTWYLYSRFFSLEAKLDAYVQAYVDQGLFSGSVLVAKDGKILLSKGYGMANLELSVPNRVDTKFKLASVTKTFTAMAIMQLQEMGLLNVQDSLSKYIPDYPNGDKITIHHLLTHTSGIGQVFGPNYKNEIIKPYTLEMRIALFKNKPLEFNPGEKFAYTDNNYVLLTYIIEKTSGTTYEKFLQEHVFDPLGMKDSGSDDFKRIIEKRAAGYSVDLYDELVNADYIDMSFEVGAGALYSTLEDLYRYDRALYTDKLLPKKSLEKMFIPFKDTYGYGWHIDQSPHGKVISHSGGNPGVSSFFSRNVDHNVCIIVLSNFQQADVRRIANNLQQIVFDQTPEGLPKKPIAITLNPAMYNQYVGTYSAGKENLIFVITKERGKLFTEIVGLEKYALYPESETEFFLKFIDAHISFVKNKNGKVTHLVVHQGGRDHVAEKIE